MLLEDVLRHYLPRLYHGFEIVSCHAIRVTRDADFLISRRRDESLMMTIEKGVRDRRMGDAVRLQYDPDLPREIVAKLVDELELTSEDLYSGRGFTAFTDLFQLYAAVNMPKLKDRPQTAVPVPGFERAADMWSAIRGGDVLTFHPYQSFDAVTRFVDEAALDPKVLAIKMTLYRVSPTSPIAQSLRRAAEAGKEVSVLVELQARFDEEANITWARALEEVGAHVVYGMVGYKTHCKVCLVVRQEADGIRRYCHLATGNYNVRTAGIYSDLGLFTCREIIRAGSDRAVQSADRIHPTAEVQPFNIGADRLARTFFDPVSAKKRTSPAAAVRRASSPRSTAWSIRRSSKNFTSPARPECRSI